jgi:hypothetical protein
MLLELLRRSRGCIEVLGGDWELVGTFVGRACHPVSSEGSRMSVNVRPEVSPIFEDFLAGSRVETM